MVYQEYLPSEQLKDIVKNYWLFEVPDNPDVQFPLNHETLPESEVSLVLIQQPYFSGVRLLGPHTGKFQRSIHPDSFYFGIRLHPWLTFTPELLPKQELLNTTEACPEAISSHFNSIDIRNAEDIKSLLKQIEESLIKLFTETLQLAQLELVKYICIQLSQGNSVADTIEPIPLSVRVIQKRFKKVTGLTMRQYHSISRQRNLWSDLMKTGKDKSDLVHEYRFYDQAHFINDFRKKMDRTHTDFERYLRQIQISLV